MALAEDCHERGVKIGTQMLCSLFLVPECDLESENVIVHQQKTLCFHNASKLDANAAWIFKTENIHSKSDFYQLT